MDFKNRIYCSDCRDVFYQLIEENIKVDLIYLDPPFNSNSIYNLTYRNPHNKSSAQQKAFYDMWTPTYQTQLVFEEFINSLHNNKFIENSVKDFLKIWLSALNNHNTSSKKLLNYLLYMTERLILMKAILKDTGSIYLHCDPTASHYLKVIMDGIFGMDNFINEITWERTYAHNLASKRFDTVTDTILFYTKSKNYFFNPQYEELNQKDIENKFPYIEEETNRRFQHRSIEESNNTSSAKETRVIDNITYSTNLGWRWSQKTLDKRLKENNYLIYKTKNGKLRYKIYADEYKGKLLSNLWKDIKGLASNDAERLGYPTQKPRVLLERIINASCPKNGIVLDPFCGCGTTIDAAIKLNKIWIGIDISSFAIDIIENRIKDAGLDKKNYILNIIRPKTWDEYEKLNPYQKQDFLIRTLGGIPNQIKSGDKGIDGELTIHLGLTKDNLDIWGKVIFSVKTGKQCNPSMIRELKGTMQNCNASIGVLILDKDPTFNMLEEVEKSKKISHQLDANLPPQEFNSIQIYTAQQILNGVVLNVPPSIIKVKKFRKLQGELFNH